MHLSQNLEKLIRGIIWICFAVIIFSPLYVSGNLFFPFIVTKTIAFCIAVEVMFVLFLFLSFKKDDYKIRLNWPIVLFAIYIVLITISSLIGDNFYRSFWSNNERSEGILLLIHLFIFLIVASGFFRKAKDWFKAFEVFIFSSLMVALVAVGQYLGVQWLFESSGGARLAGTIGNAGYMAGFLIFGIFLSFWFLFRKKNFYWGIYYAITILLELFVVFFTFTRGGIIALSLAGFLFFIYVFFFYFKNKWLKLVGVLVVLAGVGSVIAIFTYKDSDFVLGNRVLSTIASISMESETAQNRLWAWNSAWQGFNDRPIFGWGYENFYQPFDQYYNPGMYRDAGSVIWFDRAHNVIFDRLLTGGVLGLVSYLAFLFLPFYLLWRYYFKKELEEKNKSRKYFLPFIFSLILLAYFIQNFFIFEALVIYIPLFLVMGFVGIFSPVNFESINKKSVRQWLFIIFLILLFPVIYLFNIKPLQANLDVTKILGSKSMGIEQRVSLFRDVLGRNTFGNQEYRRQLFTFVDQVLRSDYDDQAVVDDLLEFTGKELNKQLEENPYSATNYLLVMRFNNLMFNRTGKFRYLEENGDLFEKLKEIAPNRQHIYLEIGYSYLYAANYFSATDQTEAADNYYDMALTKFKKALSLNDRNFEMYRQLSSVLIFAEHNDEIKELLADLSSLRSYVDGSMDEVQFLIELINTAVDAENYEIIEFFADKLIAIDPNNPQYYIQLALSYAYQGRNSEAISVAEKVAEFGAEYTAQTEDFINRINNGEFAR